MLGKATKVLFTVAAAGAVAIGTAAPAFASPYAEHPTVTANGSGNGRDGVSTDFNLLSDICVSPINLDNLLGLVPIGTNRAQVSCASGSSANSGVFTTNASYTRNDVCNAPWVWNQQGDKKTKTKLDYLFNCGHGLAVQ